MKKPTKTDKRVEHRKGQRASPDLYKKIIKVLKEDRDKQGIGMLAYHVSQMLGTNDVTTRLYLQDLVKKGEIVSAKILNKTVYHLPE